MPQDDGSQVGIAEQSVVLWVPDIGYVHYVRVCNKTNQAKEVYIQSNPYRTDKNGNQQKLVTNRASTRPSKPTNACG